MANINSYSENLAKLTEAASEMLEVAAAVNETIAGNDAEVVVNDDVTFPSYQNVLNRVDRVERTVSRFTAGKGVVETDDGTYRKIRVDAISRPANNVTNLNPITHFTINPNWFFESLQYPRCVVDIDLAGKIEEDADRVYVCRLIVNADNKRLSDEVLDEIKNSQMSYGEMVEYLEKNYIEYREDKDEIKLPLTYEKFNGEFTVTAINLIKNQTTGLNQTWYYLSDVTYATVDENGTTTNTGYILNVGDYLRFGNSLFTIKDINQGEKRVRLEYNVGYDTISLYDVLELYNDPFKEKVVSIGIGINEIDIIYVKGVNEKFNVLSRDWSNPVVIETNKLLYSGDETQQFDYYYNTSVADFGQMLIAKVKEGQISAYQGKTPNAPVLKEGDLQVVQINTQLNATLDSKRYKAITSEIASVKSNISATRSSISANKNKLITEYNQFRRDVITNSINSDTDKLNNFTTQFSSLVDELNTLLNDAGAISYSPKYHVRGFFSIPEPQYSFDSDGKQAGKQVIIAFETMYRYLHTDNTGTRLSTFKYTDSVNNVEESGVFTDWSLICSPTLDKQYNSEEDKYEWKSETLDGTHVTINQIDIPIRAGEKVELKVRSISEAGYPYAPLKSAWSNSIIISFPENLSSDDSVTSILDSVKSDMTSVVLQETLSAAGVYTHISDSNAQYKHNAENIEYTETIVDSSTGNTNVVTMSVADKLRSISGNTAKEEPSVDFSIGRDSSIYTGKIKIHTPNLTKDTRAAVDKRLNEFIDDNVYKFVRERMEYFKELDDKALEDNETV